MRHDRDLPVPDSYRESAPMRAVRQTARSTHRRSVSSFATNGGEPGAHTGVSAEGSLGGHLALRGAGAGQDCGGIAVQYLVARVFADIGHFQRLPGPIDAELGAVGAADDALGAIEPHGRLDRVRAERVAIDIHFRLADA